MMRKYIFLILLSLPYWVYGQKPRMEFKETTFQFGEVKEGDGKVSHLFRFKNTGTTPLIIRNVRSGCGCTTPAWNRQPIAPGATGTIKVTFDPKDRLGAFVKSIAVNSNASNSVITLTVRGNVVKSPYNPYQLSLGTLRFKEDNIHLGNIFHTQKKSHSFTFINTGKKQVTLSATPSHAAIQIAPTTIIPPMDTVHIAFQYHADQREDWGFLTDQIHFTDDQQHQVAIRLICNITEDFSSYNNTFEQAPLIRLFESEASIEYTTPNSTYEREFYIQNTGKADLIIRKIVTQDNEIGINLPKMVIKPGKKIKATLHYKSHTTAKKTKLIRIICNSPTLPTLNYKLHINSKS